MIRFFVLVIVFSVAVYLVLRLVRRALGYGKSPLGDLGARSGLKSGRDFGAHSSKDSRGDSGLARGSNEECELVACARCGSFTPMDSAIKFRGDFYCSKACLPD